MQDYNFKINSFFIFMKNFQFFTSYTSMADPIVMQTFYSYKQLYHYFWNVFK